ncbi:flagellar basal body P-ring protein FlgI [Candidatus Desantisbacteria bacterium]|nr:flagellar basal body P-ring protein FlgI [Candidatus Desantisbacteria bacterium]
MKKIICIMGLFILIFTNVYAESRIKDIAKIDGIRDNMLIGYGIVVGLNGTGDGQNTMFTIQSVVNMLQRLGVSIPPDKLKLKNVAAVIVTAKLPPFVKQGNAIDVTVSSLGDSQSLQGGILLITPLSGGDGKVYAVAQGPISIGGFSLGGGGGEKVQKNFPTVGCIPNGAIVERNVNIDFANNQIVTIILNNPDFTTAARVAVTINNTIENNMAKAIDAASIQINIPLSYQNNLVNFLASLENLNVAVDSIGKVVIAERTGTVVMGENVRISTVAIAHGNLSLEIKTKVEASQPAPLSQGKTTVFEDTDLLVNEEGSRLLVVPYGANLGEVVKALNAIGVTTRDLIAVIQAIKKAGALQAELEIM